MLFILFILFSMCQMAYTMEPASHKKARIGTSAERQYQFLEAVQSGLIAQVKNSIDRKEVDVNAIIPRNTHGIESWAQEVTPLYVSVRNNDPIVATMLLGAGARVNLPSGSRIPLLHLAVIYALGSKDVSVQEFESKLQMVDLFLAYGADYTSQRNAVQDTIFHQIARALVAQSGGVAAVVFDRLVQSICCSSDNTLKQEHCIQKVLAAYTLKNALGFTPIDLACCEYCTRNYHSDDCKRHYFYAERLNCLKE